MSESSKIESASIRSFGTMSLVFSLFLGFMALFSYGLGNWGSRAGVDFPLAFRLFFMSWGIFALAILVLSIMLIIGTRSKRIWYALMFVWLFVLMEFMIWDLSNIKSTVYELYHSGASLVILPIFFSIFGISFLSLKKVKRQFSIENKLKTV
jgi:hypothetical protein